MNSGNKGIINHGNTCYLNSIVQCLTHILFFHPVNKKIKYDYDIDNDPDKLMYHWLLINGEMWNNETNKALSLIEFIKSFKKIVEKEKLYFENFDQNDAEEFITLLFDMFHKILKKSYNGTTENKQWIDVYKNDYSLIVDYFYNQSKLQTLCTDCNHEIFRYEPSFIYQLCINDSVNSIEDAFRLDCQSESMDDYTCDHCKKKAVCLHKKKYNRLSDLIVVQLKLYNKCGKINRHIEYSESLDMTPYTVEQEKTIYELVGFVVHMGNLHGGHYYSICKNLIDKKWRLYNDTQIQILNENQIFHQKPYILFYKRQKN